MFGQKPFAICGVLFVAVVCSLNVHAQQVVEAPWADADNIDDFIITGSGWLNVESGEITGTHALPRRVRVARPVKGLAGHVVAVNASYCRVYELGDPVVDGAIGDAGFASARLTVIAPSGPTIEPSGISDDSKKGIKTHLAIDQYRMVWFADNDVWRGEMDWVTGEIKNRKRVTQLQVFTNHEPLAWTGNHLFIHGNFNPKKPLVRVDLVTGEIQELDWLMFEGRSIHKQVLWNPTGKVAIHPGPEAIRLIDMTNGKVTAIGDPTWAKILVALKNKQSTWWYDETTLHMSLEFMGMVGFGLLDLKTPAIRAVEFKAINENGDRLDVSRKHSFGNTLHLWRSPAAISYLGAKSVKGQSDPGTFQWVHLDLTSNEVTLGPKLTYDGPKTILNRHQLIYTVTDQGLTGNGTFLFDLRTGKATRLVAFTDTQGHVLNAAGDLVLFSRVNTTDIYRVKIDGSDLKQIAKGTVVGTVVTEPLDLTTGLADKPWEPDDASIIGSGKSVVTDRARLKELIKDEPVDVQEFALSAYNYADQYMRTYDTVKAALAIVQTHKYLKEAGDQNAKNYSTLVAKTDFSKCLSREGLVEEGTYKAKMRLKSKREMDAAAKVQAAKEIGERYADICLAWPEKYDSRKTKNVIGWLVDTYDVSDEVRGQLASLSTPQAVLKRFAAAVEADDRSVATLLTVSPPHATYDMLDFKGVASYKMDILDRSRVDEDCAVFVWEHRRKNNSGFRSFSTAYLFNPNGRWRVFPRLGWSRAKHLLTEDQIARFEKLQSWANDEVTRLRNQKSTATEDKSDKKPADTTDELKDTAKKAKDILDLFR